LTLRKEESKKKEKGKRRGRDGTKEENLFGEGVTRKKGFLKKK